MRTMDFYSLAQQGKRIWAFALARKRGTTAPFPVSLARSFPTRGKIFPLFATVLLLTTLPASAQEQKNPVDLTQMNLEDLMQLEVTSVSKKEQPLLEAPAAIYVITQE